MSKKNIKVIEGSGFLAKKFKKYSSSLQKNNVVVYVAGVSNSLEKNPTKFNREFKRFTKFYKTNNKKLVYISTYSVLDGCRSKNRYVKNKIKIERLIKRQIKSFIIIRLPEIVGLNKNPYTLTNFFYNKIKNNESFHVWSNAKRNLLDVEDAIDACVKIIRKSKYKSKNIINILNYRFIQPLEIIINFEKILKVRGNYRIKKIKQLKFKKEHVFYLKFKKNYLIKTLKKYYQ